MSLNTEKGETSIPAPFDEVAANYDQTFGRAAAGRLFRFRLSERIEQRMRPGSRLLDIGSGTGEDAVWLSGRGFSVIGLDPSPAMVDIARGKAARWKVHAEFLTSSLLDLNTSERFDGVYSNFGAMNCLPVETWLGPLSERVKPGGVAFLVLMGQKPLPAFLRNGPRAWRRNLEPRAVVGARTIGVTYPGPQEIERALRSSFRIDRTETLGAVVPEPGMAGWPRRNPVFFGLLAGLERVLSRARSLCVYSDHFLIELTRR